MSRNEPTTDEKSYFYAVRDTRRRSRWKRIRGTYAQIIRSTLVVDWYTNVGDAQLTQHPLYLSNTLAPPQVSRKIRSVSANRPHFEVAPDFFFSRTNRICKCADSEIKTSSELSSINISFEYNKSCNDLYTHALCKSKFKIRLKFYPHTLIIYVV